MGLMGRTGCTALLHLLILHLYASPGGGHCRNSTLGVAFLNTQPVDEYKMTHLLLCCELRFIPVTITHGEVQFPVFWPQEQPILIVDGTEEPLLPRLPLNAPPVFYVNQNSFRDVSHQGQQLMPNASHLFDTARHLAVEQYNWTAAVYLYDHGKNIDVDFLDNLQKRMKVIAVKLKGQANGKINETALWFILKRIRQEKVRNIILKCRGSWLKTVFNESEKHGLLSKVYHWIIPTLHSETQHFEQLLPQSSCAHFSLFVLSAIQPYIQHVYGNCTITCILLHDLNIFLQKVMKNCSVPSSSKSQLYGLSGPLKYRSDGFRRKFNFITKSIFTGQKDQESPKNKWSAIAGKRIKIIAVQEEPLFMCNCSEGCTSECNNFSGFLYDVLQELAMNLHFNYTVVNITDRSRILDVQQSLGNNEADFALCLCSLHGNHNNKYVEFSFPLMDRGYQMIVRKQERGIDGVFEFLHPFHVSVWLSILLACIVVAFILSTINRMHPYEWKNLAKRGKVSREEGNSMDLLNCLGFTLVSMVQQGVSVLPLSYSGKIVAFSWWFFVLVTISTYTANLAAIFQSQNSLKLESLSDLVDQNEYVYGTYKEYPLVKFLKASSVGPFQDIWEHIEKEIDKRLVTSEISGLDQASTNNFVFLASSAKVFDVKSKVCNLTVVGEIFFKSRTALMFPRGSVYVDEISAMLQKLQVTGRLEELENHWLEIDSSRCEGGDTDSEKAVEVRDTEGIFYLLCIGLILGFIVGVLEWMCHNALEKKKPNKHP
uniref:glutamate receptor ionotropic, kainate 2-like n=1 Tax=Myxine glutinosa TaxID=7769 RepID=UPI00358EB421